MEKYVIYRDIWGYKVTPESNYNSRIQDARKIIKLNDCKSMADAVALVKMFSNVGDDQIIIKGDLVS
jgi:hypothetical protein